MNTHLPASIQSIEDAKKFLTDLANNGESYHPEDNALDCLTNITDEEGATLNRLMNEIYMLKGNESYLNMAFDPCQFLLEIDPDYKRVIIDGEGEEITITEFLKANAAPDVEPLTQKEINAVNEMKIGDVLYFGMSTEVKRVV